MRIWGWGAGGGMVMKQLSPHRKDLGFTSHNLSLLGAHRHALTIRLAEHEGGS